MCKIVSLFQYSIALNFIYKCDHRRPQRYSVSYSQICSPYKVMKFNSPELSGPVSCLTVSNGLCWIFECCTGSCISSVFFIWQTARVRVAKKLQWLQTTNHDTSLRTPPVSKRQDMQRAWLNSVTSMHPLYPSFWGGIRCATRAISLACFISLLTHDLWIACVFNTCMCPVNNVIALEGRLQECFIINLCH